MCGALACRQRGTAELLPSFSAAMIGSTRAGDEPEILMHTRGGSAPKLFPAIFHPTPPKGATGPHRARFVVPIRLCVSMLEFVAKVIVAKFPLLCGREP